MQQGFDAPIERQSYVKGNAALNVESGKRMGKWRQYIKVEGASYGSTG
jgi:hypothetical protein